MSSTRDGTGSVRLLKFESNKGSFGPFGVEEGMPFNFRVKDNEQIVGFKGRNGWYLDGIGFHISRAPKRKLSRKVQDGLVTTSELYGGVRRRVPWDDGIYDGVREITLVYGQCIDSICFAYDQDGQLVKTGKHGGFGGNHLHNNLSTVEVSFKRTKLISKNQRYQVSIIIFLVKINSFVYIDT